MELYTDYPIEHPVVLYDADVSRTARLSPVLSATVTLLGGKVTINGLMFTSDHASLRRLETGADCLFLLKKFGTHYFIAGRYEGAFAVRDRLAPIHERAYAVPPAYTRPPAERAISDIIRRLQSRRR